MFAVIAFGIYGPWQEHSDAVVVVPESLEGSTVQCGETKYIMEVGALHDFNFSPFCATESYLFHRYEYLHLAFDCCLLCEQSHMTKMQEYQGSHARFRARTSMHHGGVRLIFGDGFQLSLRNIKFYKRIIALTVIY
jgi:hypothetical protein